MREEKVINERILLLPKNIKDRAERKREKLKSPPPEKRTLSPSIETMLQRSDVNWAAFWFGHYEWHYLPIFVYIHYIWTLDLPCPLNWY